MERDGIHALLWGWSPLRARAWTAHRARLSVPRSPGGSIMRRYVFASSLCLALATAVVTPSFAAPAPAVAAAEKPLLDVKADPLTGKIIATFPKPDASGVSARYI